MNKNFIDEQLLHQIRLERVENGIIDDVLKLLDNANKKARNIILTEKNIRLKKHYKENAKYIEQLGKELEKQVEKGMNFEKFVEYELKSQKKFFYKNGFNLRYPSKEQIITASLFKPFASNSTFKSFLDSIDSQFYNTWDASLRTGYLLGTSTQKIVHDVIGELSKNGKVQQFGSIETLKNSIKRNARTFLQSMANETREEVFRQNEELFSGYKYLATLDKRTCLVCGKLDGLVKNKIEDFGVTIPIHYNCRCVIIPIVKGFEDMDDTRASKGGPVNSKLTYEEWFESQSEENKKYILGKSRFELYEKGKKFTSFVSDNRIIKLEELKSKLGIDFDISKITGARSIIVDKLLKSDDVVMNTKVADEYYNNIRNLGITKNEKLITKIANNSGIARDNIEKVFNHLFFEKHKLDGEFKYFDSDSNIIIALERIRTKEHTDKDILLLKHEFEELTLMKKGKYNYKEAHELANKKFNWEDVIK